MSLLSRRVRELALRAGGLRLMRGIRRNAVRILLYHRFPPASRENLVRQCEYLRRCYTLVTLRDIDRWLFEGLRLPSNALAVTVDDGHRDFYTVAYPVFRSFEIPVTAFLTSGFLDGDCWLWSDQASWLFQHASRRTAELRCGGHPHTVSLETPADRAQAADRIKRTLKRMSHEQRLAFVHTDLPAQLDVELPAAPPAEYEPLLWDEVRAMTAGRIDFGAHTVTHPILSTIASPYRTREEILRSRARIEEQIGRPVPHFAYPNGTSHDISDAVVGAVKCLGFRSAFMASGGLNTTRTDPYQLRRITVEPGTPPVWFGRAVTGWER